jgi:hypothetical protein
MEKTDLLLKTIGLFFALSLALQERFSMAADSGGRELGAFCLAPDAPSGGEWKGLCGLWLSLFFGSKSWTG